MLAGCSNAPAGKYVSQTNQNEYIRLSKEGTFTVFQEGGIHKGAYTIAGGRITLEFDDGTSVSGTINGKELIDPDNVVWKKE